MIVLYQQTKPIEDPITNEITGYDSVPVIFPDTFPLMSGLKFDFKNNIVERNGKKYYLDKSAISDGQPQMPTTNEWKSTYGNTIEYVYYSGLISEMESNPSASTSNIAKAIYKSQGIVKYVIEYTYDINNNVKSINSIAPAEVKAADIDDKDDEQIIDESDRRPIFNLNIIPFVEASGNVGAGVAFAKSEYMAFASQTIRNKPVYSDSIRMDSDVSKVMLSVSNANWQIQAIALDDMGNVISVFDKAQSLEIAIADSNIKYIALCLVSAKKLDTMRVSDLSQVAIGLNVRLLRQKSVSIHNPISGIDTTIKANEGDTLAIADIIPPDMYASTDEAKFVDFVDDKGAHYSIDDDFVVDRDASITAQYAMRRNIVITNNIDSDVVEMKAYDGESVNIDEPPAKDGKEFMYYQNADNGVILLMPVYVNGVDLHITAVYTEPSEQPTE